MNNHGKPQFLNTPIQRFNHNIAKNNVQNYDILPEDQNNHTNQNLSYSNAVQQQLQPNINTNNPHLTRNLIPQTGSHVSKFNHCLQNNPSFDKQPQLNQFFVSKLPYTRQQIYSTPYQPNIQTKFSTQNANYTNQTQNRSNQPHSHNSRQYTNQSTSSNQSITNRPQSIYDRPVNNLQKSSSSNQHLNQSNVSNSINNKTNNQYNKKTYNQNKQNTISNKNFNQILDLSKKI